MPPVPRGNGRRVPGRAGPFGAVGSLIVLLGLLLGGTLAVAPAAGHRTGAGPTPTARPGADVPGYTGLAWAHLHRANVSLPDARIGAALAYDPAGGGDLLFGGCSPTACPRDDSWWDVGGVWSNLSLGPGAAPDARYGAAVAYDAATGAVLLVGGCGANGSVLGDAWAFASGAWTPVHSTSLPPARCGAVLAVDPALPGLVLFGGRAANGSALSDLWTYAAGNWTLVPPGTGPAPSARWNASLAYDPTSGGLILVGGRNATLGALGDEWRWAPSGWTLLTRGDAGLPAAREGASLVSVPPLHGDVLFGGATASGLLGDTWLYVNGSWTNASGTVPRTPAPRAYSGATYDASSGYALLEGGRTNVSVVRNDTWAFLLPMAAAVAGPISVVAPTQVIELSAAVTGGLAPYHYNWTVGSAATPIHRISPFYAFPAPGQYTVTVYVADSRGVTVNASRSVDVAVPALSVTLGVAPARSVPGQLVTLSAQITGGTPPYTSTISGLPPGCRAPGTATPFSCAATAAGSFVVGISVTDAHGSHASSEAAWVVVGSGSPSAALAPAVSGLPLFDRWGWILVPPLAAAVVMAAYASWGSYRGGGPAEELPPRPDCYVPPEWSETPPAFPGEPARPKDPLRRPGR